MSRRPIVIVHPAGAIDGPGAGYWAEVVDFPSCMAEASTIEALIAQARRNIRQALLTRRDTTADASEADELEIVDAT